MQRNHPLRWRQPQSRIGQRARTLEAADFFTLLTRTQLLQLIHRHLPAHRKRLYPPTVTLAMFLKQALSADRSCQRAVNAWAVRRVREGLPPQSVHTGGYCRARQRLPLPLIQALTHETGRLLSQHAHRGWRWRGRAVKLMDGTGLSMPDTPPNQLCFPQPSSQGEGIGFPLARLFAVICLSTGAVLEAGVGAFYGGGSSELDLLRALGPVFSPKDVVLADAFYCSYFLIASLQAAQVDVLFEQHGSRKSDFRRGRSLGKRDHLVRWRKPRECPPWMSMQQYHQFTREITVRELRVAGRILVTTMLQPRKASKAALSHLYGMRWNVELDLRHTKTTLGLEVLSGRSPPMNHKEVWVYLLAYNLIRLLMAQAAASAGLHPRQISFKHTAQLWSEWSVCAGIHSPTQLPAVLCGLIAQLQVGLRPHRLEPRARKRRPKAYPVLAVPREQARRQLLRQRENHS